MDSEKSENKAKANEKAELTLVSKHFEAVFNAVIWLRSIRIIISGFLLHDMRTSPLGQILPR